VRAPRSVSRLGQWDHRPAPTLPTLPHPPVKFVKINMPGQHQQSGGDEFLASPDRPGEPSAGDGPGALGAKVVAALRQLAEVIDQRLEFGPFGGEQGFTMEGRT
jgi:hypothetical protein